MLLRKHFHSCLTLEEGDDKILFDPGSYSFSEGEMKPEDFSGVSAVVITHSDGDHLSIPALRVILKNNKAVVLTNTGVNAVLEKEGIESTAIDEGEYRIKNFALRVFPAAHEALLRPVLQNTAYLVNETFLNPGDSFDANLSTFRGVRVLALPIMAPWANAREVGKFVTELMPQIVIPVHDGFVKKFFRERQYEHYADYLSKLGIVFKPLLHPTDFVEI